MMRRNVITDHVSLTSNGTWCKAQERRNDWNYQRETVENRVSVKVMQQTNTLVIWYPRQSTIRCTLASTSV